ncbi:YihY/virulence factor BrkB family protein [Rhizomonospora bruguierae]|uniref:YihY/virulence factor BrkB family protein n=1 Tax=Rhizomonospora bruguierae TaxID=1581705 RepID=UPI0020BE4B7F|nr:YihY/virulence factor BrkB family protein [Micromonospora sp. NBRC 107566]
MAGRETGGAGAHGARALGGAGPEEGPRRPAQVTRRGWAAALKRTAREYQADNLGDWAAALTYYGVLSLFPGLLVLVAILGLLGLGTINAILDNLETITPGAVQTVLNGVVQQIGQGRGTAGVVAAFGLVVAFWSASGYVAAFMRASNAIYDVPEGRPIWKTLPIRVGVTAVVEVLLVFSAAIVVFTGRLAELVGHALGFRSAVITAWGIVKWPVLIVLVSLMFAILYWASPNAKRSGFRWVSPGGVLAVLLWIVVSLVFGVYVGNFGSYNKTYGALTTGVIFLVWLWISNIAILLGAEFDAELERERAIQAGVPPDRERFVELRDTRKLRRRENKKGRR